MERIDTRKGTQLTVNVQSVMITFIFYLNVTDPLIIPLIFLPCCEKAHYSNKFCHENQKPHCELQITIC